MTDRRARWDERYAASSRVWSAGPNTWVEQVLSPLTPGRALDLGAGEGRHAIWLARQGWQVTAVDFSSVGVGRGRAGLAEARDSGAASGVPVPGDVDWIVDDVRTWVPPAAAEPYDLVLVAYLHMPEDVLTRASTWLAPGGVFVVVGHALRNLSEGVGGPQDPALLQTTAGLRATAEHAGLDIEVCEERIRPTDDGDAIDVVLVAHPAA